MGDGIYDVIIVGGGPGGLAAALQLGRYRWKVLLVDKGKGRASFVPRYLNLLGFPAGVSGQELLKAGRTQAETYGVDFLTKVVAQVSGESEGIFSVTVQDKADFEAGSTQGREIYHCRKLILNTGVMDRHPEVPNVFRWAGHAIYYCPDCDGYEVSNRKVIVIGKGNGAAELAFALLNWTKEIQIVNIDQTKQMSPERQAKLDSFGITVHTGKLKGFAGTTREKIDQVILEDGTELTCEKVFSALGKESINSGLAQELGAQITDNGHIVVDPRTKETTVQGCWAVGDVVASHSQQVSIAIADGIQAAIWVNKRLKEEGRLPDRQLI